MYRKFTIALLALPLTAGIVLAQDTTDSTGSASPSPVVISDPQPPEFTSEVAQKDYLFMVEKYNKARSDYLLARSQYLSAQTLAAQTQARNATAAMISSRDEVVRAYLLFLRTKVEEDPNIKADIKSGLFVRLNSEITWYENHKSRIRSAGSLNDLVADSDEAKKQFETTTRVASEARSLLPIAAVEETRGVASGILGNTRTTINNISSNGDHPVSSAQRWILEAENKLTRSFDKELEARKVLETIQTGGGNNSLRSNPAEDFNKLTLLLEESLQFIRESRDHLKEVVKNLKFVI
jgi:hypothetical protein